MDGEIFMGQTSELIPETFAAGSMFRRESISQELPD